MPGYYKSIGGDFVDGCTIKFGTLWTGPKAEKFKGFVCYKPKKKYKPSDIARVKEMGHEQAKSFIGSAAGAGAGALLFGGIGLVAGALAGGNKHKMIVAVEFVDGLKTAFLVRPQDKMYMCLKLYASENGLLEHNF